jgi:hypothetical protein
MMMDDNNTILAHTAASEIQSWLNANGHHVDSNGIFDGVTRDAMRAVLLENISWDSWGQRHQIVMAKMREVMGS